MKRPMLSLEGPIPRLRGSPFPDMKWLICELRGPPLGKSKRSKIYQKSTKEALYMPEVSNCPLFAEDGPPVV